MAINTTQHYTAMIKVNTYKKNQAATLSGNIKRQLVARVFYDFFRARLCSLDLIAIRFKSTTGTLQVCVLEVI